MAGAELTVRLLAMTPKAVDVVYSACRQCYSPAFAGDEFPPQGSEQRLRMKVDAGGDACATKEVDAGEDACATKEVDAGEDACATEEVDAGEDACGTKADAGEDLGKKEALIRKVVASGHESPLEHVSMTFAIRGISRSCSLQLVRHRLASYSQQSQRYVKMEDFGYVIPPTIASDVELREMFEATMEDIRGKYERIVKALNEKGIQGELANQDARFILPEASETKIVVTMNCRELLHFFSVRCCNRAQWEIRRLASEMLRICRDEVPSIFGKEAGAKCERLRYCPEGSKHTCGRYPLKEQGAG